LNRTAARNARAASITEASRASIGHSNSRSSASGSLGRNPRNSKGLGSSIATNQTRSSYNRASAALGLSPLREGQADSDLQLAGIDITDI